MRSFSRDHAEEGTAAHDPAKGIQRRRSGRRILLKLAIPIEPSAKADEIGLECLGRLSTQLQLPISPREVEQPA